VGRKAFVRNSHIEDMTEDRPTGPVDGETVERDDDVTVRAVGTAGLAFVGFVLAVWVIATPGPHPPVALSEEVTLAIATAMVLPHVAWAVVARRRDGPRPR
jgi:hypothetical protein